MIMLPSDAAAEVVAVAVLLPETHYLTVLTCDCRAAPSLAPSTAVAHSSFAAAFNAALASLVPGGATFKQQAIESSDAAAEGGGQHGGHPLVKHSLDRPFNKLTGVKLDSVAGKSRGRKRPLDSVGVDKEAAALEG
jgi:hypothetical protein